MTPIAEMVERMISGGIPPEFIVLAVKTAELHAGEVVGDDPVALKRRAYDRARKKKVSGGIPVEGSSPLSPSVSLPPSITPIPSTPPEPPISNIRAVANATRPAVGEEFQKFWKSYPRRDGSNPKEPARKLFLAALKAGNESAAIVAGAVEYAHRDRDKIGTPLIAQAQTWLRQRRWEDYASGTSSSTDPPPGWKPGMPTSEELRAKYEQGQSNGSEGNPDRLEQATPVDESGPRLRAGEQGVFRGEGRHPGAQKLGGILRKAGLGSVGVSSAEPAGREGDGVDGPLPVARVVHG